MASVTATTRVQAQASLPSINLPTTVSIPADLPKLDKVYSAGTGANQVDGCHSKTYSLVATTTTLDLTALTDPNGASITCTTGRVREFWIQNTSSYSLIVGNAASNAWTGCLSSTGTITIPAGGYFHFSDATSVGSGVGAVVDATHKNLKLDAGANTVTFNVLLLLCSAQS
jgi:hypothetical protein